MHKNDLPAPATTSVPDLCDVPCFNEEVVKRVQVSQPDEEALERIRKTFSLLADRSRLLILHALQEGGELCVCDVAHVLGTSVSTASHHLRRLRTSGLLEARRDGKLVLYSATPSWAGRLPAWAMEELRGKELQGT
ncbi:MAG: metalloregulator ArsR/SmtB family transcription factor [Gemmatimonadota bacterium]